MRLLCSLALLGLLAASAARAGEAGDLVFADRGPWNMPDGPLVWVLDQKGPAVEGFQPLGQGRITLDRIIDASDGKPALQLAEDTARTKRRIGPFPISGGDPALTFFLETTARDMAALTGGSPFYIRNRLKDALFRGGKVVEDDGQRVAIFAPFTEDKNKARMFGFETLELRFTLGDPKLPIRRMAAKTGPLAGDRPAYVSEMVLQ
ncbi:hypothetical protein RGQ15_05290 [Paracoccus sp. MBLB3053]|uniref:Uncharacterized protein n=1 Tax=Paracoccus aurantius TaxID=3073814 RepID=A0ABU2HPL8_9RHOB|nr:hypothetical protein [Paracoccus sp. MBLB3053]MDS9466991.1 hypothetical protein [Paracoccus sp. MBLB3053]